MNKSFPNNKYTYLTTTLKPRTKNKLRNLKFKFKKKLNKIRKKINYYKGDKYVK